MPAIDTDGLDLDPEHLPRLLVKHDDLGRLHVWKGPIYVEVIDVGEPAGGLDLSSETG